MRATEPCFLYGHRRHTAIYANIKGWATLVPPIALIRGFVAALLIAGVASLYPAVRAARLSPTEALRTD